MRNRSVDGFSMANSPKETIRRRSTVASQCLQATDCWARRILQLADLSCPDMRLHAWTARAVMRVMIRELPHCHHRVVPRLNERRGRRPCNDLSTRTKTCGTEMKAHRQRLGHVSDSRWDQRRRARARRAGRGHPVVTAAAMLARRDPKPLAILSLNAL